MKKSYGFSYEGVRYRAVRWEGKGAGYVPASAGTRPSVISLASGNAPVSGTFLASDGLSAAGIPHPLVLLHGFAQSADVWDEVASRLACKRPVHAPDFVGQGESERPKDPAPYALKAVSDALLAFLRHVQQESGGLAPVVVGYSMGGRLALAAACQACAGEPPASSLPFSMLVLESAGLGPASPAEREEMARRNAENARRLREEGLAAFMEAWEQLPLFATQRALPADVRQRQRDQRLANDAEALARTFEGSGAHTMPDQEASLATIRALVAYGVPVRYVAGALDDKYGATADLVASQTPAVCHRVPAAGHNVHLEDAGAYVRLLEGIVSARR